MLVRNRSPHTSTPKQTYSHFSLSLTVLLLLAALIYVSITPATGSFTSLSLAVLVIALPTMLAKLRNVLISTRAPRTPPTGDNSRESANNT